MPLSMDYLTMAFKTRICSIYLSFLFVCSVESFSNNPVNLLKYEDTRPNAEFQQVMIDVVTGNVYIGGRNQLYRLDSNLNFKQSITTGAVMDAPWCSPNPHDPCNASQIMDNNASVLEMYPSREFILFCGTIRQGLCSVYSPSNLEEHHDMDPKNRVNLLGSRSGTAVFFGNAEFHGANNLALYAAVSYDGRPMAYSPKSMSSLVFVQNTFDSI